MTHITCRLTVKNRDQLRNPTLGNRVWAAFTFYLYGFRYACVSMPWRPVLLSARWLLHPGSVDLRRTQQLWRLLGRKALQWVVLSLITPPKIGERSMVMSVSVCLCVCVCLSAIISSELHVRFSPIFVHVTYGRGSVLLWRSDIYFRFYGWRHFCS